ncbi:MAG TPA: hypothetical protein VH092_28360, partial [Urbifossiella sp.]|nr:hypothetical protein [Urbifossiella sp.]
MNLLLRQLRRWRFRERLVRLAFGTGRLLGIALIILGAACLADWVYDRYADVPFALRLLATGGQVALAAGLAYAFVFRPWVTAPPVDDLALRAEKAIPAFDHRLVTALQLNRPGAKTAGMSPALIAEVTREAGEMAARHDLTRLIDYRPVLWGLAAAAPAVLGWAGFAAFNPTLAAVLISRQALLDADIPRSLRLENITQDVWPTGAEVVIRYKVTGEWSDGLTGNAYVRPDDNPEDTYPLAYESTTPDGAAVFAAKLPPSSVGFSFKARIRDGRTRTPGRVEFEPPPQVKEIEAWQLLPTYLGTRTASVNGKDVPVPYERFQPKGEVTGALPLSGLRVEATFNKQVVKAVLTPVERGDGNKEVDGKPLPPDETAPDGRLAGWTFPTTPRLIGYRIELTDTRGFASPAPARRGVRMLPDEPPAVEFKKESTRNPDPTEFDGKGDPRLYEWDSMPVSFRPTGNGEGETGPMQVIYAARSELGVGRVNLAYRVVPKGLDPAALPESVRDVQHPRQDPAGRVFTRLPLKSTAADLKKVGRFVPDLGLFEKSFAGLDRFARTRVQVEFYPIPSANPATEPGELEAGGRYNFLTDGLRKLRPDGTPARLEVGDTIELYMEVFDKYSTWLEA